MTKKKPEAGVKASAEETEFAIIKTGGKQYRVVPGQLISVELLKEGEPGSALKAADSEVTFSEVLLLRSGDEIKVGAPLVSGATVTGSVVALERGEKVFPFKMRRRKGLRKKIGHRQNYTTVKINEIRA